MLIPDPGMCSMYFDHDHDHKHRGDIRDLYLRESNLAISSSPVTKTTCTFSKGVLLFCMGKGISSSAPGRLDDPSRVLS